MNFEAALTRILFGLAGYVRPPGVVAGLPTKQCHHYESFVLLYVGISPKAPSADRRSRQNLRSRVRYHYRGNAEGSTLRLTLGALLSDSFGIQLRRVGSGRRLTFSAGETHLSAWMARHARVCWTVIDQPQQLETRLIQHLALPLNLAQNSHSSFRTILSQRRAQQRALARALPVLPR